LQHGKELWEELDAKLPEMTYTEAADKVRLRMFNNLVTELSVEERADLATWLADAYHNLKVNFTENTTGKIEQVYDKSCRTNVHSRGGTGRIQTRL
jgi:hypothetical protein